MGLNCGLFLGVAELAVVIVALNDNEDEDETGTGAELVKASGAAILIWTGAETGVGDKSSESWCGCEQGEEEGRMSDSIGV